MYSTQALMYAEITSHQYRFTRWEDEQEAVEKITKADLLDMFESVFFSKNSKRIDMSLTSACHSEEQEKYRMINDGEEMFTNYIKRVSKVGMTLGEFKLSCCLYPDTYLNYFIKSRNTKVLKSDQQPDLSADKEEEKAEELPVPGEEVKDV